VEAYIGEDDRASHARFGRTARNAVMYDGPGLAYVYLVYGMYHCLNVVTEPAGRPAAILIRAVEPLSGIDEMRDARAADALHRRKDPAAGAAEAARVASVPAHRLAAGPGLVGAAFTLRREHTGIDLCDPASPIRLEPAAAGDPAARIVTTPRVGIAYAGEPWTGVPWRSLDALSPAVSGPRPTAARRRAPGSA
jgi:DNA-3-methyladenine glycosylase